MTSLADHSTPPTPEDASSSESVGGLARRSAVHPRHPFGVRPGLAVRPESPMPNGIGIFSSLPIVARCRPPAMVTLPGTARWAAGLAAG
ncbi:MAG: hypothetical protein R2710_12750 [Acidimicrobiales bacterium]